MGVKPSNSYHEKLLDKCPLFVAKEKKGFTLLAKPSKKVLLLEMIYYLKRKINCLFKFNLGGTNQGALFLTDASFRYDLLLSVPRNDMGS